MAVLERIHSLLYQLVEQAVEPVVHMESKWSSTEMTKRIVGYIYKAARNEELQSHRLSSREAIKKLVDSAMQSYSAACQEKPWFFEINLVGAFLGVIMEFLRLRGKRCTQEIEEMVQLEYESYLDRILLIKAMWDSARATFKDDAVAGKVYNALHKTWDLALEESMAELRSVPDMRRMEIFTKRWIHESMQRCWNSVANSENVINERNVTVLFGNCVAPFGHDHPFSCIPNTFYPNGERPPKNWSYIRHVARNMFDQWEREMSAPSTKRRKTKSKGGGGVDPDLAAEEEQEIGMEAEPEMEEPEGEEQDEFEADISPQATAGGDEGHPECTSQEDCIGTAEDRLVQHILADRNDGDIYCESCWMSFLEQNSKLEGLYTDTNEMFE